MTFKMSYSKEELKGLEPVPAGLYNVMFAGFKPKISEKKDSLNFNGQVKIIGQPDLANRFIFASLNTKIAAFIQDFVHSFGLPLENSGNGEFTIPGRWNGDPTKYIAEDPSTWVYVGPLTSQTAEWEVGIKPHYKDPTKTSQEIVRFICKVPDCANRFPEVQHSKDMRKKA
jgi:hypothetical protein